MAPGSIFHHINFPTTSYFWHRLFAIFTFNLYHKNTKNIILSSLSDLTLVSDREGIDNPFIALVARFLIVCAGTRDLRVVSYWCTITKHLVSRQLANFWRRCRGVYAQVKPYLVPITNSYPSHYIICHLPLVFLSPTSPLPFYSPSLSVRLFIACFLCVRSLYCRHV